MRYLVVLAAVALVCGCLCCGGKDLSFGNAQTTTTEAACTGPYIQVGDACCLDENGNGICDSDETQDTTQTTISAENPTTTQPSATIMTATTQPTQTTQPTTTTAAPAAASCTNGVQDKGEDWIDCGGPCTDCQVFKLSGGWKSFKDTGYQFRFDSKEGVGQTLKYNIEIRTPDGIVDKRPISTGESFVDYLRLKVINISLAEDQPRVYVRYNREDLAKIPSNAVMLTVGGIGCAQAGGPMCEREFEGQKIRLISRLDNGARIQVTPPDMMPNKYDIIGEAKLYTADEKLVIGGFFDNKHFIQGGYSLFYVYAR